MLICKSIVMGKAAAYHLGYVPVIILPPTLYLHPYLHLSLSLDCPQPLEKCDGELILQSHRFASEETEISHHLGDRMYLHLRKITIRDPLVTYKKKETFSCIL